MRYLIFISMFFLCHLTMAQNSIYYLSDEDGNRNIFKAELSGNSLVNSTQVTFATGDSFVIDFDVNQVNGKIAYILTEDNYHGDIYVLDDANSTPVLLPNQPSEQAGRLIKWSPSGESLMFSLGSEQYHHNLEIAKMNTDGTDYSIIISETTPMDNACHKSSIDWTADGLYLGVTPQWAAYQTDHDLWFRDDNGTYTNLTNTSSIGERSAHLNSDNSTLVYQTTDNSGNRGLFTMTTTGANQTELLAHSSDHTPIPHGWLDNNTILFSYKENSGDEKYDLYLIDQNGSNMINISNMPNANVFKAVCSNSTTTGLNTINDNSFIRVYPNPTKNILRVELDNPTMDKVNIEVYNVLGKLVISESYRSNNIIDISDFKNGIYVLNIKDKYGNILSAEKIIKK